jgi:hypothetical protein
MTRKIEEIRFVPESAATVVARMDLLAAAGDGWVNLVPMAEGETTIDPADPDPDDDDPTTRRQWVWAVLGSPAPGRRPMVTWVPAGQASRGAGPTVGILHPRGRGAVALLASLGVPLPPGWRVEQDHQRRGLVVRVAPGADHGDVLGWMCRAGAALSLRDPPAEWRATVHLPKLRPDRLGGRETLRGRE